MLKELLDTGEFADCEPQSADGIAADWWNVNWIPFGDNGAGDYYCIDLAPTETGAEGQVISHSHETGEHLTLASSLSVYLQAIADGLDSGAFEYDEDCGIRVAEGEED